ncbi:MAG: tRNA (adenosine(37)-N6)-threonylcarbamoyltransferase complex transferase subunit TsaD, partial [Simkaniaceae bacterium]|nr:tRNA (adenosine(37)-N6)-threonylcarbamoyltransferase complex transferase subunit TsaD [Simkaniaceae bacterium]
HEAAMVRTIRQVVDKAGVEIDLIAVAQGPGLMGALVMGMSAAKALSLAWDVPFVGVNHIEAHLYAAMMDHKKFESFPALGIVASGGHTFIVRIDGIGQYEILGTTIDDAVGESFDKVAAMLELPYPGGPHIEELAKSGDPKGVPLSSGRVKNNPMAFSYSGLKTGVKQRVEKYSKEDMAASFQHVALMDIVNKAVKAAETFDVQAVFVGGGVACNNYFRERLKEKFEHVYVPKKDLCLDNGAMIAGLGYHVYMTQGKGDPFDLAPFPRNRAFTLEKKSANV